MKRGNLFKALPPPLDLDSNRKERYVCSRSLNDWFKQGIRLGKYFFSLSDKLINDASEERGKKLLKNASRFRPNSPIIRPATKGKQISVQTAFIRLSRVASERDRFTAHKMRFVAGSHGRIFGSSFVRGKKLRVIKRLIAARAGNEVRDFLSPRPRRRIAHSVEIASC